SDADASAAVGEPGDPPGAGRRGLEPPPTTAPAPDAERRRRGRRCPTGERGADHRAHGGRPGDRGRLPHAPAAGPLASGPESGATLRGSYTGTRTAYGGDLASTWVGTAWEKRAEVPGCLVKSRDRNKRQL